MGCYNDVYEDRALSDQAETCETGDSAMSPGVSDESRVFTKRLVWLHARLMPYFFR